MVSIVINFIESSIDIDPGEILHVPYCTLQEVTNNFDETALIKCVHVDGTVHFVSNLIFLTFTLTGNKKNQNNVFMINRSGISLEQEHLELFILENWKTSIE